MLLASLGYWREYRSYAHIAASYGIDESNVYRVIKWVEDILIKCGMFSLPGKKALQKEVKTYKVILIDATESQIERILCGGNLKKTGKILFRQAKMSYNEDVSCR